MHLLISCNDAYLMPQQVMLRSFFDANPQEAHSVWMLRGPLSGDADAALRRQVEAAGGSYHSIPVDTGIFRGAPTRSYISEETYYRLLAAEYLPATLDRILWMDADILVRKPLDGLYGTDFGGKWVVACSYGPLMLPRIRRNAEDLGLPCPEEYFNAGVMLLNLDACRKVDFNRARECFFSKERPLLFPGQDLVNSIFNGHVRLADYRIWNSMVHCIGNQADLDFAARNAAVVHFPGKAKPWRFHDLHFAGEWMDAYRRCFGEGASLNRISYFRLKALLRNAR